MKNKIGVFIGRMHPFHNGHKQIIDNMLKMHNKIIIIVGSANKVGEVRNPLSADLREEIVATYIHETYGSGRVYITQLDDLTDESDNTKEGGDYLSKNILDCARDFLKGRLTKEVELVLHYSDDCGILSKGGPDGLPTGTTVINVKGEHGSGDNVVSKGSLELFIHNRTKYQNGVSATKIREAFKKNDLGFIANNCPVQTLRYFDEIKKQLEEVKE